MRRRQAFAAQTAAREAALLTLKVGTPVKFNELPVTFEPLVIANMSSAPPPVSDLVDVPPELERATCRKCGHYIGKGIAMHRKHCKGSAT